MNKPEQEELIRALTEHSSDMIFILSEAAIRQYVSPATHRILGYCPKELTGHCAFDQVHPKDLEKAKLAFRQSIDQPGIPIKTEFWFQHKNGSWCYLEQISTNHLVTPSIQGIVVNTREIPQLKQDQAQTQLRERRLESLVQGEDDLISLLDAQGDYQCLSPSVKAIVMNARDITTQKQQEEALQESRAQLQQTLRELQKVMNYSLDVICASDAQGRFVQMSAASEKVWGYVPEELIGRNYMDLVVLEDHPTTIQAAALIQSGVSMTHFENRYIRKDGSLATMIWSASWSEEEQVMFTVARDATEMKKKEEELARIKMAVDHSTDGIGITDEKGRVIYQNSAFCSMLGYTTEQLNQLGGPKAIFVDSQQAEEVFRILDQGRFWKGEAQLFDRSQNIVDLDLRASAIQDEQGQIIGLTGICTDIRERKRAEGQLQAYANQIAHVLHSITDAFFMLNSEWVFEYVNPEAEKLLIRKKETLLGKRIWDEFTPGIGRVFFHQFLRAMETQQSVHFQNFYAPLDSWFEVSAYPSENALSVYFRDITETRLLQRVTSAEREVLEMSVDGKYPLAQVVDFFLKKIEEIQAGMIGSVLLVSEDGRELRHLAAPSLPLAYADAVEGMEIGLSSGSGTAAYCREPVIASDITTHPIWADYAHLPLALGLKACWSYPILSSGQVLATFVVYYKENKVPTVREIILIERVKSILGLLILNKKAEESIRLTNERYRLASLATNDAIWDWDLETNQLYWSEGYFKLFGYDPAASFDMNSWTSQIHPEDADAVLKSAYAVIESRDQNHWEKEYRYIKADGTVANVFDRGFILRNEEGKAIRMIGALQDITERTQSRDQLQQSEQLFRSIAENFPNGAVGILDRNLRYIYAAGTAFKTHGIDPAGLIGKIYMYSFIPEVAQYATEKLELVLNGESVVYDINFTGYDYLVSAVPVVNAEGKVEKLLLATQNITERKRMEEHLRLLESVITNAKDAIVITEAEMLDEPGPRIIYVNPAFTHLCGYTAEEVVGRSPRMLQGLQTDRRELARMKTALLRQEPVEVELVNYTKSGKPYWVSIAIVPVRNGNGKVTHLMAIERDISQRKQAEEEQKALIDELMRHNRDLQQFSYITSHNLRAPVANLMGLMGLYNRENPLTAENGEILDSVEDSIAQLDATLSDLIKILVIKNKVNVDKEMLNLSAVCQKVLQSIDYTVGEANATIELDFSQVTSVQYNRVHLKSIFQNFLTNSIRYRSPNRPLIIRITSRLSGEYVEIDFADNGLGIDLARYQERLFGLYQRFHNHPESKGLGLYIVKSEVTALGGRIEVESEVDKGTTFKVFLKTQ